MVKHRILRVEEDLPSKKSEEELDWMKDKNHRMNELPILDQMSSWPPSV